MRLSSGILALGLSCWTTLAHEVTIDATDANRQYCSGMYSRQSWGGSVDPFIQVKFLNSSIPEGTDPIVSLIIFQWRDNNLVGVLDADGQRRLPICTDEFVNSGHCNNTDIGQFLVSPNATAKSNALIFTKAVHLKDPGPLRYSLKKTGYYCVVTQGYTVDRYKAIAEFRNAYGELQATQIPKLPFYGAMSIIYTLITGYWGFLYYQHRHDIYFQNNGGSGVGSKAFLIVVGILNAARNSFSFFLLLIVCMGYGVVKHTLGRTMTYVRWLAAAHFVFGLVYSITSLVVSPESAGPFVLLIILPLAGTLTAFYVWTLNSLNFTLKDLRERKQHAKEAMYRKLWWSILVSIIIVFAFFFFTSFTFASINDPEFVPNHWKTRWFILDGWLNIVYFADVAFVAYVWRPTANNRRFAMSDEIAQDDDGNFEIGDIGVPDDWDDDEEVQTGKDQPHPPPVTGITGSALSQPNGRQQTSSRSIPRESIDGETIFAVGEDGDRFSDDGSDEENAKLVRNK
ncbi:integral membrane protein (Ptm1) [Metarhizium album ARSEF 1941]|uniref:Integral membrane protein (Ptm1) n=1 Tax=Metarhizium album (strain ARSEF 1941) TaxID=1081103 RepID=A0A0B2X5X7_METAS|nr:integral membrane protein (Ptm1) [Metarhizium album ARSEF 1941]KHO00855.1 integral membrane protein (Ptm1) [Metarhizium album ARSEF 1941]